MISSGHKCNLFSEDSETLIAEMYLFDKDVGRMKVTIEAKSPKHDENLKTVLEMLQGSV